MKKRVAVLGATGSIGKSALDVIGRGKDDFEVVLLSAHNNAEELAALGRSWPDTLTVLSGGEGGRERLLAAIAACGADITINGISGAAGLEPSMAAIAAGSDLALANKETLVMAGPLVFQKAREKKINIIPVDSEHSAVFHLIEAHGSDALDEIILTASGGPFRDYSVEEMKTVSPQAALAHPTWNMGPKITIDSASMANKGLEVIEAARLFSLSVGQRLPNGQHFPPEKIKVVIHPQSIVHSMIRMKDGAVYAQLSRPDMRLPIHKALYWSKTSRAANEEFLTTEFHGNRVTAPRQGALTDKYDILPRIIKATANSYCRLNLFSRARGGGKDGFHTKTPCNSNRRFDVSSVVNSSDFGRLDFDSMSLTFYQPDTEKFPMLALAYEAVKKGALYPCAYNGANEAAVSAFLAERIGFLDISRITRYVLDKDWSTEPGDIADILEADRQARITAEKALEELK
jgi:1-deoxy-D-xylulose-5-phosphate reductoisomerase